MVILENVACNLRLTRIVIWLGGVGRHSRRLSLFYILLLLRAQLVRAGRFTRAALVRLTPACLFGQIFVIAFLRLRDNCDT